MTENTNNNGISGMPYKNIQWKNILEGTDEYGHTAYAFGEDPETGFVNYRYYDEQGNPVWKQAPELGKGKPFKEDLTVIGNQERARWLNSMARRSGYFNNADEVRDFQIQNGLEPDGIVGKETIDAINRIKSSNLGKGLSLMAASVAYNLGETA